MEPGDDDAAGPVERDPRALEQGPLHRRPSLETAETAVGAHGPVAGDDERERVRGQGVADGPDGARPAEMSGDEAVRADAAARDAVLGPQHSLLESRTGPDRREVEGEPDRFAAKEVADRGGQGVHAAAGARPGVRVQDRGPGRRRRAGLREEDAEDPGAAVE